MTTIQPRDCLAVAGGTAPPSVSPFLFGVSTDDVPMPTCPVAVPYADR